MADTPRRSRKTNAERRDESRNALLNAGADLVVKASQVNPFAALRVRQICDAAQYSTGAFYLHWENVDEYHDALSQYLLVLDGEAWETDFSAMAAIARDTAVDDPLSALFRIAESDFNSLISNPTWDAMELLMLTWGRTRYRDEAVEGFKQVDRMTARAYGLLLKRLERETRPPFTAEQVATLLQGLVEGLGLRHRVDPDSVTGTAAADKPTSLYPLGAACLLAVMTRPKGDDRDAVDLLRELLSPPPGAHSA